MRQRQIENIKSLCQKRIRQVISYQEADLLDELPGERIEKVPTIGTYTITFEGTVVECLDLLYKDGAVYCLNAEENTLQVNINLLDEQTLNVIAEKISDDIAKAEEWADNFFG